MEELAARIANEGGISTALLFGAVVYLWQQLKACQKGHIDCERKNLLLAEAIEDLADGKGYEAKAKAGTIVDAAKAELKSEPSR